jgi:hypothetical protein
MFKKLMIATAATAALGLTACGGGDENNSIVIEGDTVTTTNNNTTTTGGGAGSGGTPGSPSTCPTWASSRPIDDAGKNVCQLPGTITVSRTLDSDIVWYMAERVTVGNGNQEMSATKGVLANGAPVLNVTLTIEPGTQIKGATGSFANLLITRGSRIMAEGTASAPIVFSSDDADMSGPGEWGGLIIHGYGVTNFCTDSTVACNVDSEGESGFAGGYTPDDDSGVLRYVIVTEGGFQFAPGNEINGISLMSAGSGTTLEYIQIHDNADDGIEYYGGDVDTKYLVVTGAGDDSIDWDEGFNGNIQYALIRQTDNSEGNAIEADTDGSTTAFLSKPTLSNITFIGDGAATTMLVFKARSGGFLHNSILTTAEGSAITSCVTVSGAPAQALRNTSLAVNNLITNCGAFGDEVLDQSTVTAVDPALSATYVPGVAAATLAAPIDFAAFNAANSESTAKTSFLDNTSFIGAVNPSGGDLWFQGWTLPGTL